MKKTKEDLISKVKSFMTDNSDTFELNNTDFKVSKRVASGLGFGDQERKIWGDDRAEVTVNILRPYINKLTALYDSNPFGLDVVNTGRIQQDLSNYRLILDHILKTSDFNTIMSDSIRETVNDGLSYILVYHEDSGDGLYDIKLKRLDNRAVFFPYDCKEANGSDAKMVVHADIIDKDSAKSQYNFKDIELKSSMDILNGLGIIENSNKQCGLVTVYEKIPEGVKVSTIIHSKVVDETILPITNIPIVRCYGEHVTLDEKTNWRGVYYFVSDLLRSLNFFVSLQQERIACSTTTGYILAEESLNSKDTQWSQMAGAPRAYLTYKAYSKDNQPLPTPQRVSQEAQLSDLTTSVTAFQTLINSILGDTGAAEPVGNETAESVLLRKSNTEASVSLYLRNAKDSSIALGRVIIQMAAMVFNVERLINNIPVAPIADINNIDVVVINGPIAATQKEKIVRQLVAFGQLMKTNPEAQKLAAVIIENLDIDKNAKQLLIQNYANAASNPTVLLQQAQAQMTQKDQQIAQMTQQLQTMQNQVAQLQQALFEYQKDSKAILIKAQMDNESKERIEMWKIQAGAGKLDAELENKRQLQSQKLLAEYFTDLSKYKAPEQFPLYNASKFT